MSDSSFAADLERFARAAPADLRLDPTQTWRAGRRLRVRDRVLSGAAALIAVALVVSLSGVLSGIRSALPGSGQPRPGPAGYPQRIAHQWWVPDLPPAPGPMAGLVHLDTADRAANWQVIDASGRRYRLPIPDTAMGLDPSLSPDGTRLLYLADPTGGLVLRDLISGDQQVWTDIGDNWGTPPRAEDRRRFATQEQVPSAWSPDGRSVALRAMAIDAQGRGTVLVLRDDGSRTVLPIEGVVSGWLDAAHLAVTTPDATSVAAVRSVRVSDGSSPALATLPAPPDAPAESFVSQWSVTVTPAGRLVRIVPEVDGSTYRGYTQAGRPVGDWQRFPVDDACAWGWVGERPAGFRVVGGDSDPRGTVHLGPGESVPLLRTEPIVRVTCVTLASAALERGATADLFGTSDLWVSWWWRELALGLLLATVAVVLARSRRPRL